MILWHTWYVIIGTINVTIDIDSNQSEIVENEKIREDMREAFNLKKS